LAFLEKGRKLLEQKGPALGHFSCMIVTGTVMLNLFSEAIVIQARKSPPIDAPFDIPGHHIPERLRSLTNP
jgi:hypothetical protein